MAMVTHVIFILSSLTSVTVSSDVFKVVGSSVQLHMNDNKQTFKYLTWMYNKAFILKYETKSNIETPYNAKNSRMEFDMSDYSLTINNLEKNDSGLYGARLTTDEEERIVVEYRLSVLDPAEIPVISPVHHQQSSDTCNLTCRGHDLSIISNCYNHICENKETSSGGHTLSMFVSGSTIICNHSNPVSWKESTIEIKDICSVGGTNYLLYTIIALSCVALTLLLTVVGCVIQVKRKNTDAISPLCDTVYAEVENETERPRNGGRLETDGPSTLYSIIGMLPRPSDGSAQQQEACANQILPNTYYTVANTRPQNSPSTVYSKVGISKPETVYGAVKKVNKAADGTPSHRRK
ncbi:SLAM family member 7-like isoform X2 [Brachyhypopomus gauderio]|uniref:SLAM family member 7-like isoform X2 n=1 Tax=Brachyhypopomus gauderio TaxID=698409 RepID=UPI0040437126